MTLASAAARARRGTVKVVAGIRIRAETRTLAASGDNLARLECRLLRAHSPCRGQCSGINRRLVGTQNTGALAKRQIRGVKDSCRHFL